MLTSLPGPAHMSALQLLGETRHRPATDWLPSGRLKGDRNVIPPMAAKCTVGPCSRPDALLQGCTPVEARSIISQAA